MPLLQTHQIDKRPVQDWLVGPAHSLHNCLSETINSLDGTPFFCTAGILYTCRGIIPPQP